VLDGIYELTFIWRIQELEAKNIRYPCYSSLTGVLEREKESLPIAFRAKTVLARFVLLISGSVSTKKDQM